MEITYLGQSAFKIKGKNVILVTDPCDPKLLGLKFPKTAADAVTISHGHSDHNFIEGVEGEPVIISGPGEYEVKGAKIIGISTYHDTEQGQERGKNTVYRIIIDGISIVHCGDLGQKFDDSQLEVLSGANILMIPVGGFYTIDAATASAVVSQISPDVIIPMHYKVSGLKKEIADNMTTVEIFLKQMGKETTASQPKLSITKDKLPPEPMVVVLE